MFIILAQISQKRCHNYHEHYLSTKREDARDIDLAPLGDLSQIEKTF